MHKSGKPDLWEAGVSRDEAPARGVLGLMVRDAAKRPLLTMRRNIKVGALVNEMCECRRVESAGDDPRIDETCSWLSYATASPRPTSPAG